MKVLLVSSGSGSRGGGEIYLVLLAKGLVRLGHEVVVAIPDNKLMDELAHQFESPVEVVRVSFRPTYQRKLRGISAMLDGSQKKELAAFIARQSPEIVHVNQQVAEDGLDLVLGASKAGLPWVSTIHVGRSAAALNAKLGAFRDLFTHKVLNWVGGQYISVSEASGDQLRRRLNPMRAKIEVVHNGVLTPMPDSLISGRKNARAEWGIHKGEVVIGAVGRIEAQKNPLVLIDHVVKAGLGDRAKVVWIGDGSLRSDLEKHARDKSVALHIDGWRNDAATRLAGLDIFVLPSEFEGLPLAILEAMHAGVPVIASNADGMPEAIDNGVTGFLCVSPSEWRDAIYKLATDDAMRFQFASAAKVRARESFSELSMAKNTISIYQSLIG